MARVALRGVGKSFGNVDIIRNVDLDIEHGEFVVFVGPSGSGKSTLLRLIAGLEDLSSGELQIDGARVNDTEPSARGVAMVFQSYALYPHMTVEQNMGFGLRMNGVPKAKIRERVRAAADTLQLGSYLRRKPSQLSGGQRQRVAIGRAIVRAPKVFLFDEPLSNLDAELRVAMRVEIAKLHQLLGNTMIYVTHDQTEAMTLADKIVVLRDGGIAQVGSPLELYSDPDTQFVAGFIGSPRMNFLPVSASNADGRSALAIDGKELPALSSLKTRAGASTPVTAGIRPEHFMEASAPASLSVRAEVVEQLGGTNYVYGRMSDGTSLVIERRDGTLPKPGETFQAGFDPSTLCLFDQAGQRVR